MPLYDYHCPHCGHAFEHIVRFSDPDLLPACGAPETRETICAPAASPCQI